MLHISVLSFWWFNHISSISKPSWRTAHIWSVSEEHNALFIGLKISAKFSYRADTVADISCIPTKKKLTLHRSCYCVLPALNIVFTLPCKWQNKTKQEAIQNIIVYFWHEYCQRSDRALCLHIQGICFSVLSIQYTETTATAQTIQIRCE